MNIVNDMPYFRSLSPLETGDCCDNVYIVICSSTGDEKASYIVLKKNLEEMFSAYFMHCEIFNHTIVCCPPLHT